MGLYGTLWGFVGLCGALCDSVGLCGATHMFIIAPLSFPSRRIICSGSLLSLLSALQFLLHFFKLLRKFLDILFLIVQLFLQGVVRLTITKNKNSNNK